MRYEGNSLSMIIEIPNLKKSLINVKMLAGQEEVRKYAIQFKKLWGGS